MVRSWGGSGRGKGRERENGPEVLSLLGSRVWCPGFLRFTLSGIIVTTKGESRATQGVNYLGQPGLSKSGASWVGNLAFHPVV